MTDTSDRFLVAKERDLSTSCYCLCASNHPQQLGVCTNQAAGGLRFGNFPEGSALAGVERVYVQMCEPCRRLTLAHKSVDA